MNSTPRDIYLSFFMFTNNLKPTDQQYRQIVVAHIQALQAMGYKGFEFPIAPPDKFQEDYDFAQDVQDYADLRSFLDCQGLAEAVITTNVMVTRSFDPSSPYPDQRQQALKYLKSRVDITAALRGEIMMGPIVIPYGDFVTTDFNDPIWSDQLQEDLKTRYTNAQPILNELGIYAQAKNVKLAIESITHWETSGPNKLSQLIAFLEGVPCPQVGVVIDSAHETLDGDGPEEFQNQVKYLAEQKRLHYIQISSPDRGAVHTSWIPWQSFLTPVLEVYQGPIAIEVFNAIPAFLNGLRLTRRKFWIPGEDPASEYPSAYGIAREAITMTKHHLNSLS